jgi:hypothetical protein
MVLRRRLISVLVATVAAGLLLAPAALGASAPGGPVLVVTTSGDPFGAYYTEILHAEGLNEFATADISQVTAQTLSSYSVVVLARMSLSDAQVAMLTTWVQGGGDLIAMRPDKKLAPLLGIADAGTTLSDGYVDVDTSAPPGNGITSATMQFHDTADRYVLAGARSVAALYSNATTATASPAVTLRAVGSAGGQAAAFTYDLARSVVWTRQGNPAWAGQERDNAIDPTSGDSTTSIRPDDLFFPDYVNLDKVTIPQADEQQRLLANLVTQMSADRIPLPRLWYFPRGYRAAVVMTGDDHGNDGTNGAFDNLRAASPAGCSVADWTCVRGTSYVYSNTTISDAQAAQDQADGFEIAPHPRVPGSNPQCNNFAGFDQINATIANAISAFQASWPGLPAPTTTRTHCVIWSDWDSQARADQANGIRLNTDYYFWPDSWVQGRAGMFTGSGMPMRFAAINGSMYDVYQATTQLPDETYTTTASVQNAIATLLDDAVGPQGFYGFFTVNMHTDIANHPGRDAVVAAAQARGVPVISARQLLTWTDGRNDSSFQGLGYASGVLSFTMSVGAGARGLQAMIPVAGPSGALQTVLRDGQAVPFTTQTIKGVAYAFVDAVPGAYRAIYPGGAVGGAAAAGGGPSTATSIAARIPAFSVLARSTRAPTFPSLRRSARTFRPGGGRSFAVTFRLARTSRVVFTVRTARGTIERRIRVASHRKGTVLRLRWDGRDTRGRYVKAATYRFTVSSITARGRAQTARGSVRVLTARP